MRTALVPPGGCGDRRRRLNTSSCSRRPFRAEGPVPVTVQSSGRLPGTPEVLLPLTGAVSSGPGGDQAVCCACGYSVE